MYIFAHQISTVTFSNHILFLWRTFTQISIFQLHTKPPG